MSKGGERRKKRPELDRAREIMLSTPGWREEVVSVCLFRSRPDLILVYRATPDEINFIQYATQEEAIDYALSRQASINQQNREIGAPNSNYTQGKSFDLTFDVFSIENANRFYKVAHNALSHQRMKGRVTHSVDNAFMVLNHVFGRNNSHRRLGSRPIAYPPVI